MKLGDLCIAVSQPICIGVVSVIGWKVLDLNFWIASLIALPAGGILGVPVGLGLMMMIEFFHDRK